MDTVAQGGSTYVKYKARLVTCGFQQPQRIDYVDTLAPYVKFTTRRLSFAIGATENPEHYQIDVKNAFLNCDFREEKFIDQQEGFIDCDYLDHRCKLLDAPYRLKQAPRHWMAKIDALQRELCLQSCTYDPRYYLQTTGTSVIIIKLYVNDLLKAGSDIAVVTLMKKVLVERLRMENLGWQKIVYHSLEIIWNCNVQALRLSQSSRYAESIPQRSGMYKCRAICTPMQNQIENNALHEFLLNETFYRKPVKILMN